MHTESLFLNTLHIHNDRSAIYHRSCHMIIVIILPVVSIMLLSGIVYGINFAIHSGKYDINTGCPLNITNCTEANRLLCNNGFSGCMFIAIGTFAILVIIIVCFNSIYNKFKRKSYVDMENPIIYNSAGMMSR